MIAKYCPKCSFKNSQDYNFCPHCGYELRKSYSLIHSPNQNNILEEWFRGRSILVMLLFSILTFGLYYDAYFLNLIKRFGSIFKLRININLIVLSVLSSASCFIILTIMGFSNKFGFVGMTSFLKYSIIWLLAAKWFFCGIQSIYTGKIIKERLSIILKKKLNISMIFLGTLQLFYIQYKLDNVKKKYNLIVML